MPYTTYNTLTTYRITDLKLHNSSYLYFFTDDYTF